MSQKDYKSISGKLEKLGLSPKEASVYMALLAHSQPVGSSKIVRATGLYGQYVYDAFASLSERGLVSHVMSGKRKKFLAAHPSRLELLAERQRVLAQETSRELATLVQRNHAQDFSIYQGDDSFIAHEFAELASAGRGEEWLIIGGDGDRFIDLMEYLFDEYDATRAKKKISMRYIGSHTQRAALMSEKVHSRADFEVRTLPAFGKSIVNTVIRPTKVSLATYGNPVLTYEVENVEVADSYRNFFEALWLLCEPLK